MKLKKSKCVYAIKNIEAKIIKIGVAGDVNTRLLGLQCSAGMRMRLIYSTAPIYNYDIIEKKAHNEFEKERKMGEWFKIKDDDIIIFLKKLKRLGHLEYDKIYLEWIEKGNVSLLSRHFNVSRAAINKHLNGYKNQDIDLKEFTKEINTTENITINRQTLDGIPPGSKKIEKHIYRHKLKYYIKIWKNNSFIIHQFKNIDECKKALNKITLEH